MAFDDRQPDGVVNENGFEIEYRFEHDTDYDPPWYRDESGNGLMRYVTRHRRWDSTKKPGERAIDDPRGGTYFFNWKLAAERARKEKWNAEPYAAPNPVDRAVQNLFDYYKAFINDDWYYVGVEVRLVLHPQYEHAAWGFETYKDYHKEAVRELASELVSMYFDDIEKGKYLHREDDDEDDN